MRRINQTTLLSMFLIIGLVCGITFFSIFSFQSPQMKITEPDQNNKIPHSAASVNTRLYIQRINQTHTVRGTNFTLIGYVQKNVNISGSFVWINMSNIRVFPIINGLNLNGENGQANLTVLSSNQIIDNGSFYISYLVPSDYDYTQNITVLANITQDPSNDVYVSSYTVQNTSISHDITTKTVLSLTTDITSPKLPDDSVVCSYLLKDDLGNSLPSSVYSSQYLYLYENQNISEPLASNLVLSPIGDGSRSYILAKNVSQVGVLFNGSKTSPFLPYLEYLPSNMNASILRASSLNGTISAVNSENISATYLYPSGNFQLVGDLTLNDNYPVINREIEIFLNNESLTNTTTDQNGHFAVNYNLKTLGYTNDGITLNFSVQLKKFDNTVFTPMVFTTNTQVKVQSPPLPSIPPTESNATLDPAATANNWGYLVIPIGIIAAVIVGLVFFQRKRMDFVNKRDLAARRVNKMGKFGVVKMLFDAKKRREAVAYTFKIFENLVTEKFAIKKEPVQTIRDFAILMVKKYNQDPLHVYPFIQLIENVIYGGLTIDNENFIKSMEIFGRVYKDLTGSLLPFNPDTMNFEEQDVAEIPASEKIPPPPPSKAPNLPPNPPPSPS